MRGRGVGGVIVGLLAIASLAGCGGSDSSGSLQIVTAAAAATEAQSTARTISVGRGRLEGKPLTIRSEGTVDFRTGDFESVTTSSVPALDYEVRHVDGATFIKSEDVAIREIPMFAGKPWTKVIDEPGEAASDDPEAILRQLRAVSDAESLGEDQVRRVSTTRYRLTLNPEKARAMAKSIPTKDLRGLDAEVWIDDAGRLRKFRLVGTVRGDRGSFVSEYYDFGVPVAVEVPPADQVFVVDG